MPLLEMKGICRSFPGVKALDDVDLILNSGEVLALLGENGAGKSTLIKILGGIYRKDSGEIHIEGRKVEFNSPHDALKNGIGIIHQELSLIPHLSVRENIFLGREEVNPITKRIDWKRMDEESQRLLTQLGLEDIDLTKSVKDLSVAVQQMVEIARVLSMNCKIIVMDEPTDTLTAQETVFLFNIIKTLKASGKGIIYISHKIEEIFEIADRVQVLRDGKFIGVKDVKNTNAEELIKMMVGRELNEKFPRVPPDPGNVALELKNVNSPGRLKDISFKAYKGEVLGIAGLVGAGRTELAKTIFGVYDYSGTILLEGRPVKIRSPQEAIGHGIVYITEDRKAEGLFLDHEVFFNMTLAAIKNMSTRSGRILKYLEKSQVNEYIGKLKIKTPSVKEKVKNLSGGNQQKLILAKWMMINPRIIILDEPTRGVDVGAKVEIYNIINFLKKQGSAIIMISSELPEILGISDRILVMHDGRITGEFTRDEATQEKIMKCAVNI
ncbi:sugar ABC transporter ATP-binding protein [Thermoanaerobacterium sp. DL9XJH110]|uniref:sugar ABC transporter ATP-binding protein n=1 Tax=Thermoanaerobacterium sp. DL9XJH110 TaxID=3386643 RepID=UPI003BB4C29B